MKSLPCPSANERELLERRERQHELAMRPMAPPQQLVFAAVRAMP